MSEAYRPLIEQLASSDGVMRQQAYNTLRALDEDALDPLTNVFYGGVNDAQGSAILALAADIGGPDALALLRNVFHFEEQRLPLKRAAAEGLWLNRANLSPHEVVELGAFLDVG